MELLYVIFDSVDNRVCPYSMFHKFCENDFLRKFSTEDIKKRKISIFMTVPFFVVCKEIWDSALVRTYKYSICNRPTQFLPLQIECKHSLKEKEEKSRGMQRMDNEVYPPCSICLRTVFAESFNIHEENLTGSVSALNHQSMTQTISQFRNFFTGSQGNVPLQIF